MYAILGATGRIGGSAARALRNRGFPVRALVRDPAKARSLQENGCELAVADVYDAGSLKRALLGTSDVLVVCPMNSKAPDAPGDHEKMIASIGSAVTHARPRSIVAISDYGAHHPADTGIALTFHRLEQRLKSIPAACTFLRSAEHMQNWSRFIRKAADTGLLPVFYAPATKLLPLVSALDAGVIAADLIASLDHTPGSARVIHVEGPRRYTVEEVVNAIAVAVGRPVEPRVLARGDWIPALLEGGLSESYARLLAAMYEAHNAGLIDVEPERGEVRRGTTSLAELFSSLLQ